jgi:hypothetical protein
VKQFRRAGDRGQRISEIVGHGVRELPESLVGPLELMRAQFEFHGHRRGAHPVPGVAEDGGGVRPPVATEFEPHHVDPSLAVEPHEPLAELAEVPSRRVGRTPAGELHRRRVPCDQSSAFVVQGDAFAHRIHDVLGELRERVEVDRTADAPPASGLVDDSRGEHDGTDEETEVRDPPPPLPRGGDQEQRTDARQGGEREREVQQEAAPPPYVEHGQHTSAQQLRTERRGLHRETHRHRVLLHEHRTEPDMEGTVDCERRQDPHCRHRQVQDDGKEQQ